MRFSDGEFRTLMHLCGADELDAQPKREIPVESAPDSLVPTVTASDGSKWVPLAEFRRVMNNNHVLAVQLQFQCTVRERLEREVNELRRRSWWSRMFGRAA